MRSARDVAARSLWRLRSEYKLSKAACKLADAARLPRPPLIESFMHEFRAARGRAKAYSKGCDECGYSPCECCKHDGYVTRGECSKCGERDLEPSDAEVYESENPR